MQTLIASARVQRAAMNMCVRIITLELAWFHYTVWYVNFDGGFVSGQGVLHSVLDYSCCLMIVVFFFFAPCTARLRPAPVYGGEHIVVSKRQSQQGNNLRQK